MRASSEWRRAYDHAYSVAKISGWRMKVRYSPIYHQWIVEYVFKHPQSPYRIALPEEVNRETIHESKANF